MNVTAEVHNPGDVEVTITMRMPLKDWIALKDSLVEKWPASELARKLADVIYQIRKTVWAEKN